MTKAQIEDKEEAVAVTVRVPAPVHEQLASLAKRERRAVGPQVLKMIEDALSQPSKQAAA